MKIVHLQVQKIKTKNVLIIKTNNYLLTLQKTIKIKNKNTLIHNINKILMKIVQLKVLRIIAKKKVLNNKKIKNK